MAQSWRRRGHVQTPLSVWVRPLEGGGADLSADLGQCGLALMVLCRPSLLGLQMCASGAFGAPGVPARSPAAGASVSVTGHARTSPWGPSVGASNPRLRAATPPSAQVSR